MNLTPLQKQKLVSIYPELRMYFDIQDIKERRTEADGILIALINKIQSLKGEKGDKPVRGVDYQTQQEVNEYLNYILNNLAPKILEKSTPIKGVHYKDGENYILTSSDKKEIASQIDVPIVDRIIEKTEVIKEVMPKSIDVSIVKNAVSKKELEIEKKEILSGMQKVDGRIKLIDQRWHGGGLSQVYHDGTLSGTGSSSNPLSVIGGGSGFQLPLTGSVNGSNQTFTWATAPNAIVVDGQTYAATTQDISATPIWTGTTTTVFTSLTPNQFCYAVA